MKRYTGARSGEFNILLNKIQSLEKYTTRNGICESILCTVLASFSYEATTCLTDTLDGLCDLIEFVKEFQRDAYTSEEPGMKQELLGSYYYPYQYQPTNSVLLFCFINEQQFLDELNSALDDLQRNIIEHIARCES